MAPSPVAPPKLDIPSSKTSVKVSIIDTTTRLENLDARKFLAPDHPIYCTLNGPAFSFLIEHPSGKRILFDLGVRKDWWNMAPSIVDTIKSGPTKLTIEKNASEILSEHGIELSSIKDIIWSHRHFDHQGDPSQFPKTTSLTVGPGFKDVIGPGYPEKKDSKATSDAWEGRDLIELSFENDKRKTKVDQYQAIDYFGDGSFYLLATPGHTNDHMCGFARTKATGSADSDEFILMGGDVAHHGGEFRPTKYGPIPEKVEPDPRRKAWSGGFAPGELFAKTNVLRSGEEKYTRPFFQPRPGFPDNEEQAQWSLDVLEEFDAVDNVLPIFAHDASVLGVVDFFPKSANDWKDKGWKKESHFRFLADLNSEDQK